MITVFRSISLPVAAFLFATVSSAQVPNLAIVDAAGFQPRAAPDMLASGFTAVIEDIFEAAVSTPLPTELAGYSLTITDSTQVDRPAGLIVVALGQVNFLIPPETALGSATATLRLNGEIVAAGALEITAVAPGLFSANSSGSGAPAGSVIYVAPDESQRVQDLHELDGEARVPKPFDLGADDEKVILVFFATGVRGRSDLSNVTASIDGVPVPVAFADDQGEFLGLDQINLGPLPRILSGRGMAQPEIVVDDVCVNLVDLILDGPELVPAPSLSSVDPASATQGETVELMLVGEDLLEVTEIELAPADDVAFENVISTSTTVTARAIVDAAADPGERTIDVLSPQGRSNRIPFTIQSLSQDPMISNLVLNPNVNDLGITFTVSFDFDAPAGNLVFNGTVGNSAHMEAIHESENTTNVCRYRVGGPPLHLPGETSGRFRAVNTPLDEDDVALGPGTIAITLIDAAGARSNTIVTPVEIRPVCPENSEFQNSLFPAP